MSSVFSMALFSILVLVAMIAESLAYPALVDKTKRSPLERSEDMSDSWPKEGPLEDVSRVLDRYARQIANIPRNPDSTKRWSPLHRAVLRGALQVTKQLLGYEGWTPDHLELLQGEREILLEHVADEASERANGQEGPSERTGVDNRLGPNERSGVNDAVAPAPVPEPANEEVANGGEAAPPVSVEPAPGVEA